MSKWLIALALVGAWIGYTVNSGSISIATIAGFIAFAIIVLLIFRLGRKNANSGADSPDSVHGGMASVSDSTGLAESEQGTVYHAESVVVDDVRPEPDEQDSVEESPAGDEDWVSALLPGSAGGSEGSSPIYDELDGETGSDLRDRRRFDGAYYERISGYWRGDGDLYFPEERGEENRPTLGLEI